MSFGEKQPAITEVIALVQAGDKAGARQVALDMLRLNPEDITALLWLAYTSNSLEEVEVILKRVLLLDPANQKALEWQSLLQQKQLRVHFEPLAALPPNPPGLLQSQALASPYPESSPQHQLLSISYPENPPLLPESVANALTGPLAPNDNRFAPLIAQNAAPSLPQIYQPSAVQPPAPLRPTAPSWYSVTVGPAPGPTSLLPAAPVPATPVPPAPLKSAAPFAKWRRWQLIIAGGSLVGLGLAFLFLVVLPRSPQANLADYRLYSNLDEMQRDAYVGEKVVYQMRFKGGYTRDTQGNYVLDVSDGKNAIYILWNEGTTPVSNFKPGQAISVYGQLIALGSSKATLKVDRVLLTGS